MQLRGRVLKSTMLNRQNIKFKRDHKNGALVRELLPIVLVATSRIEVQQISNSGNKEIAIRRRKRKPSFSDSMTRKKRDGKDYSAALQPESSLDFGDGSQRRRRRQSPLSRAFRSARSARTRSGIGCEFWCS